MNQKILVQQTALNWALYIWLGVFFFFAIAFACTISGVGCSGSTSGLSSLGVWVRSIWLDGGGVGGLYVRGTGRSN